MPASEGKWAWSQRLTNSSVVAVVLIRPSQSIAVTLARPDGWTGERKEDQDLVRAILSSAAEEQWRGSPVDSSRPG